MIISNDSFKRIPGSNPIKQTLQNTTKKSFFQVQNMTSIISTTCCCDLIHCHSHYVVVVRLTLHIGQGGGVPKAVHSPRTPQLRLARFFKALLGVSILRTTPLVTTESLLPAGQPTADSQRPQPSRCTALEAAQWRRQLRRAGARGIGWCGGWCRRRAAPTITTVGGRHWACSHGRQQQPHVRILARNFFINSLSFGYYALRSNTLYYSKIHYIRGYEKSNLKS